jgi:hypothetical protein
LNDEGFNQFYQESLEECLNDFLLSAPKDSDRRELAYQTARGLQGIVLKLNSSLKKAEQLAEQIKDAPRDSEDPLL